MQIEGPKACKEDIQEVSVELGPVMQPTTITTFPIDPDWRYCIPSWKVICKNRNDCPSEPDARIWLMPPWEQMLSLQVQHELFCCMSVASSLCHPDDSIIKYLVLE